MVDDAPVRKQVKRLLFDAWNIFTTTYMRRFQFTHSRFKVGGIIGAIAYPLYYFLWKEGGLFPQPHESLTLRIIGAGLFALMALKDFWPEHLRKYYPVHAYITLLYNFPFFSTYMLLMNQEQGVWLVSTMMMLLFVILLVDWLSVLVMYSIGVPIGALLFFLNVENPQIVSETWATVPMFVVGVIAGVLLNYSEALIEEEKRRTMLAISANIAHEMRTPLLSIKSGAGGIGRFLPILVEVYEKSKNRGDPVPIIRTSKLKLLASAINRIEREVDQANTVIDMLLMNARDKDIDEGSFTIHSMVRCINDALERYPFQDNQFEQITFKNDQDFLFSGSDVLFTYVLFNLIRNALYAVAEVGGGDISIRLEVEKTQNIVYLRDNGLGITRADLSAIFTDFMTTKAQGVGTGLGLAFCKRVMASFGGEISCVSKKGVFTEFALHFPLVDLAKHKKTKNRIQLGSARAYEAE